MSTLRPPPLTAPRAAQRAFLDEIERRVEPLLRGRMLADWRLYTGRSTVGPLQWQLRRHRLLSAEGLVQWAEECRRNEPDQSSARRLELLQRLATDAILEEHPSVSRPRAVLQRRIARFRPTWKGKRVDRSVVRKQLRTSPDRDQRRAAWYSTEPLYRSVEEPLRRLVRTRNARARELGFRSYPEYRLGFEGFNLSRLKDLLDEVTRPVRAAAVEKRAAFEDETGLRGWCPWDAGYADELAVRLPERAFGTASLLRSVLAGVRQWGFSERRLRFNIDHHDGAFGGIAIPVDPPRDVRVVVGSGTGWTNYMILFHEVGHAVQDRSTAVHPPLLRWYSYLPGFPGFLEGIGTLFEEIPKSPEWLVTRPGIDRRLAARFASMKQLTQLAEMSWLLAWIRAELELYRNPEGDIGEVRGRWLRRLGGYDAFDPPSFADFFYVEAPVYSQNYLFAMLFARQLLSTLRKELGGPLWPNRRFGPWLTRNWFRSSGEFDWVPRLEAQTGRPFGAEAFNRSARATLVEARKG
ncbi:MAG: hypothetical protein L3K14_01200 [Thermoplasmata archaeon]|nr:hypothetical protein [Thermoplasmata archaeon]